MQREERILVVLALVIIAAMILYQGLRAPNLHISSAPQTSATTAASTAVSRFAVDINSASYEELMGVRGMREGLADAIVQDRAENGRYDSVEDITRISGVGPVTLERLRPYLTAE